MHWLNRLLRKERAEKQLDAELRFHLEKQIADYVAAGISPEEARRRAHLDFGGLESIKQQTRESRRGFSLDTFSQDLRYALRTLRKSPAFTAVAVLTLALGIGANTAIFTLINALLLRTLPVRNPGELVELLHSFPNESAFNGFPGEVYPLLRDQNHVFAGLIAATYQPFNVRVGGSPLQTVDGGCVSGNFFQVLGVQPALGRLIAPEDDRATNPSPVAVLSWPYWKNSFNSDPAVLGRQIIVEDVPVTVVGVVPRGFRGLSEELKEDLWLPLSTESMMHRPVLGWGALNLVGRLKPGVSIKQARAEMAVLFQADVQLPNPNPFLRNMKIEVEPAAAGLTSSLRQQFTTPLIALMALVGLLLLIACANIASMLLARGAARQREMALRVALGAGRLRLMRLVLTEPLLISAAGGLLAILFAYFGAGALVRIMLSGRPIPGLASNFEIQVRPDLHVLFFTAAAALFAVFLSGLSPVLRALGTFPATALRQTGTTGETSFRRLFGRTLIAAQVSLAVVSLSAAALFVGYLSNLERRNLGFRRDHLLLVTLDPSPSGYKVDQVSRLYPQLLARLEAIPGVRSVTLSATTPVSGRARACYCVTVEGHEEKVENLHDMVFINSVAPNFFATYGIPLLAGRDFAERDQSGSRAAIISKSMAGFYFGETSPIGKHLTFGADNKTYEIVGVVGDTNYNDIFEAPPHTIYLGTFQFGYPFSQLTLRTSLDPETLAPEARSAVRAVLSSVPVTHITTMTDQVDASIVPERLIGILSGWFGALGALLVAIGLYGALAYTMARRTNEIGVRMALGATRGDVSHMVLGEALRVVFAGLAIGAPFAFWGTTFAKHWIADLPSNNAAPIAFGAAAMIAVTLIAAYLPARRASRVDPMVALRYE